MHTTDFRLDESAASIGELWLAVEAFAHNRVDDNERCAEYPVETRVIQTTTLERLVQAINEYHAAMLVR